MKLKNKLICVYIVSALCYFIQGISGLPSLSLFKYFKEVLMYTPEQIMMLNSVVGLAWIPKIIWGFAIDSWLSRKQWILISIVLDLLIVLCLGIFTLPIILLITMLFMSSTNSAVRDVAVDGEMVCTGKLFNITGSLQSLQWISITCATILTGVAGGWMADNLSYKTCFLLLMPFYIVMMTTMFFYKDTTIERTKTNIKELLMGYKRLLTKPFLIVCLFLFLYKFSPSFGTLLSYIERDKFNWSFKFIGMLSSISSIVSIFGAMLYWKFCKKLDIKKFLFYSIVIGAFVSLSYLYYTPVSAIIYLILYSFIGMFIHLIVMDFMARTSVSGYEASTFAILCGISNLATGTASSFSGALLAPIIGLQGLIVLSAFTSFLCLPLLSKINLDKV